MKKKIISVVLAAAMLASLAACGSGSSSSGSSDTFKIGGIGPITGGAAVYGNAVKNAIELAVNEVNEAGGVNGTKFEMKFEDDEHDAEKAVNAYNTLKDWKMQILIGNVTSAPCEAVVEKSQADGIFQFTPSATSVNAIQYDNAFRMCFSDPNQGKASAEYISDKSVGKKIAVIYDSSDTYSSGIYTQFAKTAKEKGLNIVSAEAFTADSNKDFTVQVQKAKEAGADVLFLPIYYTETALILQQANKIGYKPTFFGCDGFDGILAVENFDKKLAEGIMFLTPFTTTSSDEKTQNFVKNYKEKYGDIPNQFAADAYDCVYVVKQVLEEQGGKCDMSAKELGDLLKKGMTSTKYSGLTGSDISWGEDGEPNKEPIVVKVVNGEYVVQ